MGVSPGVGCDVPELGHVLFPLLCDSSAHRLDMVGLSFLWLQASSVFFFKLSYTGHFTCIELLVVHFTVVSILFLTTTLSLSFHVQMGKLIFGYADANVGPPVTSAYQ